VEVKSQDGRSASLRLSIDELRLVFGVLSEVDGGANALDDADWDLLIGEPRHLAIALIDQLQDLLGSWESNR
jgi:hypothetical protein